MPLLGRVLLFAALAALAACATPAPPAAPAIVPPPPPPRPGVARVLGHTPDAVIALLGAPTLERTEGQARQLQFARPVCVLDIFFYPDRSGRPAANYAEARTSTGAAFDANACVEAQLTGTPVG